MLERVVVEAPAKVNLSLQVGKLREDNYHDLCTVFVALTLTDTVTLTRKEEQITFELQGGDEESLGPVEKNLAVRAAHLIRDTYGDPSMGAHILLEKRIPVAAGLAGGSADAAATLLACSELWGLRLSRMDLMDLGAQLGADVPFALLGGVAIGRGRGDELAPVLFRGTYHWVIVYQEDGLSTAEAFNMLDFERSRNGVASLNREEEVLRSLMTGDPSLLAMALSNDFQELVREARPEIDQLFEFIDETEALGAVLCGSGPSVAFLCPDLSTAYGLSSQIADQLNMKSYIAGSPGPGAWVTERSKTKGIA